MTWRVATFECMFYFAGPDASEKGASVPPRQPPQDVCDDRGKRIGTVQLVHLGRNQREFWEARSLDGCDLGAHPRRVDAEWAIQDDNDAGRPRDRSNPRERWRPVYRSDEEPIYLGTIS